MYVDPTKINLPKKRRPGHGRGEWFPRPGQTDSEWLPEELAVAGDMAEPSQHGEGRPRATAEIRRIRQRQRREDESAKRTAIMVLALGIVLIVSVAYLTTPRLTAFNEMVLEKYKAEGHTAKEISLLKAMLLEQQEYEKKVRERNERVRKIFEVR